MLSTSEPNRTIPPIAGWIMVLLSYVVNYFGYGFLSFSILIGFTFLVFIYISIWGPEFIGAQYLSSLLWLEPTRGIHIDGGDIMRAFSLITLILQAIVHGTRMLWAAISGKLFGVTNQPDSNVHGSVWRGLLGKILAAAGGLTIIFIIAVIRLPYVPYAPGAGASGMLVIFTIFYFITLIGFVGYLSLDTLSKFLYRFAQPALQAFFTHPEIG